MGELVISGLQPYKEEIGGWEEGDYMAIFVPAPSVMVGHHRYRRRLGPASHYYK